jgi:hypothetical protein
MERAFGCMKLQWQLAEIDSLVVNLLINHKTRLLYISQKRYHYQWKKSVVWNSTLLLFCCMGSPRRRSPAPRGGAPLLLLSLGSVYGFYIYIYILSLMGLGNLSELNSFLQIFLRSHASILVFYIDLIFFFWVKYNLKYHKCEIIFHFITKEQDSWVINTPWILQEQGTQSLHA